MTPEFAYFLKVNVAFILLYAFYRLFFYKDTFFKLRRTTLLACFLLSMLYPLFNIQDWIREQEPIVEVIQIYSAMLPETTVASEVAPILNWDRLIRTGVICTYWAGFLFLLIRFLLQLGSILLLAYRSRQIVIHDVPVYLLDKPTGPFSFFRLIFIHPESHSEKEVDEILTHECTHVFQWHSIDVIVSELIAIGCWVNPFVWLLKREVRHNLEYLADNTVLESGYDSKSYQYHLLGLAHHHKSSSVLYNSFNVLHLKNRISMMNKKRSRSIGRTKYLIFLPVVAILMVFSNIEVVARITKEIASNAVAEVSGKIAKNTDTTVTVEAMVMDEFSRPLVGANVIIKGTTTGTITDVDGRFKLEAPDNAVILISQAGLQEREFAVKDIHANQKIQLIPVKVKPAESEKSSQVFTVVEKMPEFPGGQGALLQFLAKSVKYPVIAQENGIEGRVSCSFIIEADGSIRDAEVIRSVDPSLDTEALRVINSMPVWKPGMQRGQNVAVKYTVPVTFRLGEGDEKPTAAQVYEEDKSGQIFTVVEKMPQFPGGQGALIKYIEKNIQYPVIAQENGIQGRVSCSFVINADGSIENTEVIRGVDPSLDKEALRLISTMPKWEPGIQRGKKVRVKYTVPVTFKME